MEIWHIPYIPAAPVRSLIYNIIENGNIGRYRRPAGDLTSIRRPYRLRFQPRRHAPRRECPYKPSRQATTGDAAETLRLSVSTRTHPAGLSEIRYGRRWNDERDTTTRRIPRDAVTGRRTTRGDGPGRICGMISADTGRQAQPETRHHPSHENARHACVMAWTAHERHRKTHGKASRFT